MVRRKRSRAYNYYPIRGRQPLGYDPLQADVAGGLEQLGGVPFKVLDELKAAVRLGNQVA